MSRTAWIVVATLAVGAAAGGVIRAQQAPGSGFTTATTAVVVDVVVRDQKGAPVVDLKQSDFELFEDEVKQKIASVELIAPGAPARAAATAAAVSPKPGASEPAAPPAPSPPAPAPAG